MMIEVIKEECEKYEMGFQTEEETLNMIEGLIRVRKTFNNMNQEERDKFFKALEK